MAAAALLGGSMAPVFNDAEHLLVDDNDAVRLLFAGRAIPLC